MTGNGRGNGLLTDFGLLGGPRKEINALRLVVCFWHETD
jgi:hypothetical protein